jgi:poly-gamma-glutamate synthesis protein (capsule biosynthesis protein)
MNKTSVIIGGDIAPTVSNFEMFSNGSIDELVGAGLKAVLETKDIRIFNLEVPLYDGHAAIDKHGDILSAPLSVMRGIRLLTPSLLTLANNHIMDHGIPGYESTIQILCDSNIPFVGAGKNLYSAACPYIFEKHGKKIGIYACAEHEFSIASEHQPGANPFDPLESPDHVQKLKSQCDYVIVLYHGGKEHYRYPSPYLQKVCRKLVEKGADLVVCQHSHSIGCKEEYQGGIIVYGQGNFIFDSSNLECWKTGLLIEVHFENGMHVDYIPIVQSNHAVRLADQERAHEIMEQFEVRSRQIMKPGFIEDEYSKLAEEQFSNYLISFFGRWFFVKVLRKLLGNKFIRFLYSQKARLAVLNSIDCEAHRELILAFLKKNKEQ